MQDTMDELPASRANNRVDLKAVVLGQSDVGKTCLVNRYLRNYYGNTIATVGVAFGLKRVTIGDKVCNLGLWDTAGLERFDSLNAFYCRKANAALICYSILDRNSFLTVQKWIQKVKDEAEPDCLIILVGTKCDLVTEETRQVTVEEASALAVQLNGAHFETSAKEGVNVKECIDYVVAKYMDKYQGSGGTDGVNLVDDIFDGVKDPSWKSKCCG